MLKGNLLSLENLTYGQIKTCFGGDTLTEMEEREYTEDRLERYGNRLFPGGAGRPCKHLKLKFFGASDFSTALIWRPPSLHLGI